MVNSLELKSRIRKGFFSEKLKTLYVTEEVEAYEERMIHLIKCYEESFGEGHISIISAPGRTELGGNHTDHQAGCVLAASVNLDILIAVAPNNSNTVTIQSEGYPLLNVDLNILKPQKEEINKTEALVRGIAAKIKEMGYELGGFNGYAISDVLAGSGLSSSAAYETLIGQVFNHLYCNDEISPIEIAKIGQYAENVFFNKPCGLMDQMATSVGNIVSIDFKNPKDPVVDKVDFHFGRCGYALCIIDSGADHADLTEEYATIPKEMKAVASAFGKELLREVPEKDFLKEIPQIRKKTGDRAILRAAHFYNDSRRAQEKAKALKEGDFTKFLQLSKESGLSSYTYLQNVYSNSSPQSQPVSLALMMAERLLDGKGAYRVHGGGFAGTIQAFVPEEMVEAFAAEIDRVLGEGACHVLKIRPEGGVVLVD